MTVPGKNQVIQHGRFSLLVLAFAFKLLVSLHTHYVFLTNIFREDFFIAQRSRRYNFCSPRLKLGDEVYFVEKGGNTLSRKYSTCYDFSGCDNIKNHSLRYLKYFQFSKAHAYLVFSLHKFMLCQMY